MSHGSRPSPGLKPKPASRVEGQLRATIVDLEARLAEVTRCLESAETRASELLATRERVRSLEAEATARVEEATARVEEARSQAASVVSRADDARDETERKLAVLAGSRSWRGTKPLRSTMKRVRRLLLR